MPIIHLIAPAQPVAAFGVDGANVTVAGITVDCAAEQQDAAVTVDIRYNAGAIERGGDGAYVAIIGIPAREYTNQPGAIDPETGAPRIERVALPIDPNAIVITLWPAAA